MNHALTQPKRASLSGRVLRLGLRIVAAAACVYLLLLAALYFNQDACFSRAPAARAR